MELVWFALGAMLGTAAMTGIQGVRAGRADAAAPPAGQDAEPDGEAQAYLRQYRNFLCYDGSGRGQEPIEDQT